MPNSIQTIVLFPSVDTNSSRCYDLMFKVPEEVACDPDAFKALLDRAEAAAVRLNAEDAANEDEGGCDNGLGVEEAFTQELWAMGFTKLNVFDAGFKWDEHRSE